MKSAERITAVLYSNSIDALAALKPDEITESFKGATFVEILLQPGITVLDMVLKAQCFANESNPLVQFLFIYFLMLVNFLTHKKKDDARRIILAGGVFINQQKCTDYTEILALNRHILVNGISLIRVGKFHHHFYLWGFL